MKKLSYLMIIFMLLTTQISWAEQKVSAGHFELHYNTFPSTFLSKEIANTYQITRSKNRGIVSISVIDKSTDTAKAVEAEVTITAKNLLNQNKEIKFFKIVEANKAVYYLGSFALNDQEDINFSITATPTNSEVKLSTKFSREFFTD
ncbi:DUF4426 domain-containing protein [Marinicella litoralis]|uniref:Uncharacterized protein DUF4426 n=1 Tax=Marinicella litoralis TaxID=644220 RepID=A0A4R6XRE3_9GAMM|nr:DUF4426 domain-containing protein [Marinicella litoralis]TDR22452.1 uncharacterized protein DUF4426 [Marinicella litoralis]